MSSLKITLIVVLLSILEVGLAIAIILMPEPTININEFIESNLFYTELFQPTTAVLLNFRSYDTLLTSVILLLIFLGIYPMPAPTYQSAVPSRSRWWLSGLLLLMIVMILGYLLWKTPVYAMSIFPIIGALLAISVISLLILHFNPFSLFPILPHFFWHRWLTINILIFLMISFVAFFQASHWLEYPTSVAGYFTITLQTSLTLTFGLTLILLLTQKLPNDS